MTVIVSATLVLVAWFALSALVAFEQASPRAELIGHEGTAGRMFLGVWRGYGPARAWGVDVAVRVRLSLNRACWVRVSVGPMFRRRFGFRRFHIRPRRIDGRKPL